MTPTPSLFDRLLTRIAPRADAAPVASEPRMDAESGAAVLNTLSGLGGSRDSGAMARPNLAREYLTEEELDALMRGSVYRRIVELKPKWATSEGFALTDSTDDDAPLADALKRIDPMGAFREADIWGRAFGEALVLMVTDDPAPLHEPLDPARVRRLHRLEVFDRREFTPVEFCVDARIAPLGSPVRYQLHPMRPGVGMRATVHASRVLRFYGDELAPSSRGYNRASRGSWGADAIGQTLWDGIRHLAQTGSGGARIAQELTVAVFTLGSQAPAAGDQRTALLSRMSALNMMKSIANAVWLAPGERFERVAAAPTGFKELSDHARLELALLTGYPLTLLFGIAPGGLSTDGESWQEAWRADVASYQRERYRPPLLRLVEVLYYAERGGPPPSWDVAFAPLGTLTEEDRAAIRLTHTQADAVAVQEGILTVEEVRSRYTAAGGFAFELQPVEQRQLPQPRAVDPAIEAAARRLVEQQTDAEDRYTVPAGARGNAARVLRWREEHPDEIQGMTETGWRRARQLATAETISAADLVEIAAWFARHGEQAETRAVAPEYASEPWRDAGWVAWLGWGGDTMARYARERRAAMREDATPGACWIGIPLPEAALPGWRAARATVEAVAGALLPGEDAPHTTVLYLGQLDRSALAEVVEAVRTVATRTAPMECATGNVTVFPAGPDGVPVVAGVRRAWGLDTLHIELLGRLAHLVTSRQHHPYRAHVTLGYAAALTGEQQAAVIEAGAPELVWTAARLEVWYGGDVVEVVPLTGRGDGSARG